MHKEFKIPLKDRLMFVKRGIANDIVIEDPNEQTHSEFPTKKTIQGGNERSKSIITNSVELNKVINECKI